MDFAFVSGACLVPEEACSRTCDAKKPGVQADEPRDTAGLLVLISTTCKEIHQFSYKIKDQAVK